MRGMKTTTSSLLMLAMMIWAARFELTKLMRPGGKEEESQFVLVHFCISISRNKHGPGKRIMDPCTMPVSTMKGAAVMRCTLCSGFSCLKRKRQRRINQKSKSPRKWEEEERGEARGERLVQEMGLLLQGPSYKFEWPTTSLILHLWVFGKDEM